MSDQRPPKGGWAPGYYECRCRTCNKRFHGAKGAYSCADCAYAKPPKQEGRKFNELVERVLKERTAQQLAEGFVRYEMLRKLPPLRFAELVQKNIQGVAHFDDLVERVAEETK